MHITHFQADPGPCRRETRDWGMYGEGGTLPARGSEIGRGEGGTLPARGSQIGRGEGGLAPHPPPPRSLEEPRITPGGPPSPTLPELRWGPFYGLQRGSQAVQLSLHLEIKMSSTSLALKRTHFPQLSNITHIVTQTQRVMRVEGATGLRERGTCHSCS